MDSVISKRIFQERVPCKHQIDSFNWMIRKDGGGIDQFIKTSTPWTVKSKNDQNTANFEVEIELDRIDKPKLNGKDLTPQMARSSDQNYFNEVFINAKVTRISSNETIKLNVNIGAIPCLVGSDQCNSRGNNDDCQYDMGGYFIIDGREKTIVSRERMISNHLHFAKTISTDNGHAIVDAECRVTPQIDSLFTKVIRFNLQAKRIEREKEPLTGIWKYLEDDVRPRATKYEFSLQTGVSKSKPQLFALFRALEIESDRSILSHIFKPHELKMKKYSKLIHDLVTGCVNSKGEPIHTHKDAINSIVPGTISHAVKFKKLCEYVYPNVTTSKEKAVMLGIHARKIIDRYFDGDNEKPWTANRDNFRQKRVDVCGTLILEVFRDAVNKGLKTHVIKKLKSEEEMPSKERLARLFSRQYVDDYMLSSFKGNWGKLNDPSKAGTVEDLDRLSYTSYISHIRRVKSPIDAGLKLTDPHKLGPEQFGYFCPFESPDGANVGLIKHLTTGCVITTEIEATNEDLGLNEANGFSEIREYFPSMNVTTVFRNNTIVGFINDPGALYEDLLSKRRNEEKLHYISFYFDVFANEFHVFTDAGRCMRPLLIVKNVVETMDEIKKGELKQGKAYDYVELAESNYHVIASDVSKITDYTRYCELSPLLCLGNYMSSVPLLNHNPSARAMLGGQQAKQAIGVYSTKFRHRFDTISYILHYPQKSLISTRNINGIKKDDIPNGQNVIMAIAAMGYNQEDAVIINKNSVERGMFAVSAFKTMRHELLLDEGLSTTVENVKFKHTNSELGDVKLKYDDTAYDKLQENGLPKTNNHFQDGELLLGCLESKDITQGGFLDQTVKNIKKDVSITASSKHNGFVDGYKLNDNVVKIKFRQYREPTLGDKLASMHGQKGVVGMIVPQDEMPFSKDGLVPDVVINPYAFPKRMTIGHLLECLFGRAAASSGNRIDATAFDQHDFDKIYDYLENKKQMNRSSNELMYNPRTGHQLEAEIFMGPMYYYRLKHMAKDKIQYRADIGGTDSMTGQPAQGRAKKGGLKIGEMEMNSLVSHGASTFLKEAIVDKSDGVVRKSGESDNLKSHHIYVDSRGDTLISNYDKHIVATKSTVPDAYAVRTSKTFQVLKHELNAASIDIKLKTAPIDEFIEDYASDEIPSDDEEEEGANPLDDPIDADTLGRLEHVQPGSSEVEGEQ